MAIKIEAGSKFGKWTVTARVRTNSKRGRQAEWECRCDCGAVRVVIAQSLRTGRSASCGCHQREVARAEMKGRAPRKAQQSPRWSGGSHTTRHGYVMVYAPEHPRAKSRSYVQEHILVMEEMLGRHLYQKETVHHKNGLRNDNRPENLELWCSSHVPGQRVVDLVEFARSILATYEAEVTTNKPEAKS